MYEPFRFNTLLRARMITYLVKSFRLVALSYMLLGINACTIVPPRELQKTTNKVPQQSHNLIPLPNFIHWTDSSFLVSEGMSICVSPSSDTIKELGQFLADKINTSTGYHIQVSTNVNSISTGNIILTVSGDTSFGDEGYDLTVSPEKVLLIAHQPAGLFWGIQTIRQLLPPAIESTSIYPGPWMMETVLIKDYPRFSWRGSMLDVARHFLSVKDVKRFIDLMACYKLNRLHLHLTDDQGWRIMFNSWPNLATHGGSTQVGGGPGGYYTQADYSEIVTYAQKRYITIIPEIDMPGHTNAALASYAGLNCTGVTPPLYKDIGIGFSSLCVNKESTYTFVRDVMKELCTLTPGKYIHIGGDEANSTNKQEYFRFIDSVQIIVQSTQKQMVGWNEISSTHLFPSTIVQHWVGNEALIAVQHGIKIIMSPASRAYLDMKYKSSEILGQDWAGCIEVQDAYMWDPASELSSVTEKDILGIEAPLWTETIQTMNDIEYMTFPRLAGYAEIGWSEKTRRNWLDYKDRLANHGLRLAFMGVNYYKSPQIQWK